MMMQQQNLQLQPPSSYPQQQQQQQQQLSGYVPHEAEQINPIGSPNRISHPITDTPSRDTTLIPSEISQNQKLSVQTPSAPSFRDFPKLAPLPTPKEGGFGSSSISRNGSHLEVEASPSRTSLPGMLSSETFVHFQDSSLGGLVNSPVASAIHSNDIQSSLSNVGLSLNSPATGPVINPPPPPPEAKLSSSASSQEFI
jgi:hypothetical protein